MEPDNRVNNTEFKIIECSPKAALEIESHADTVGIHDTMKDRAIYPYELLRIGESFTLPLDPDKEAGLRNLASRKGTYLGKKFKVIKHNSEDVKCYEIARIA